MATTPPPPDGPTRRLRPARAVPVVEERIAAPIVDPSVLLLRIEDAIDSLRTWLAVVGLIAVAALGVALYALLSDDSSSGGGSRSGLASDTRVSQLEDRVDTLSHQLQSLRAGSGGNTTALDDRVGQLERTVKTLSSRPAAGDPQQAIDELSGRIDDLTKDVDALKQSSTTP